MTPRRSSPAKGSRAASAAAVTPAAAASVGARLRHDGRRPVADACPATFAVEQAKAELGLEFKDLAAQRGLAHVAGRGRAAKMAVIGNRDHIFEVSKVHG